MPPDPEEVSASVFAALADPNRRAILASLAEHGPSTATDLSGRLAMSRQGVSKHLALLAEAGLVTSLAGGGRRVLFRHRSEPIKVAQSYLAALAADWDTGLDRLSAFLDSAPLEPPNRTTTSR
jgi:DNA-binding transcriptional ArsR family regulator